MRSKNWNVVDAHPPMRQALEAERVKNPDFAFAKDGVHPGRAGHWVMASCILQQYFGDSLNGVTGAEQKLPRNSHFPSPPIQPFSILQAR
jgi:hypothetical protein